MLQIKSIDNQAQWDSLVKQTEDYTFLQSWSWGQVNADIGETVWRFAIYDDDNLVSLSQFFTQTAKRGKILFIPHGPLFISHPSSSILKFWLSHLKDIATKHNCLAIRISPFLEKTPDNQKLFKSLSFHPCPVIMHAEDTWLVDLRGEPDDILASMRKTTRNLIRRALRDGQVWVKQSTNIDDIDTLYKLQLEVVKRNNFVPFSKSYLKAEAKNLFKNNQASLFIAGVGKDSLASALIVFFGKFAYYYQSGSISSKYPVNYLLQWNVLLEAKKRNCQFYNMWGIAPQGSDNHHPWHGLTIFKTGFGGLSKVYMPSQDYVIRPSYWLMYLVEKIPKTWRNKLVSLIRA